ncbi:MULTISPECIES: sugar phosphate isomerase [unclassified Oceanispirochaeta]|uniref:sugar phosphate isomerase n=1 Tax=unclassified Oceanispirochaeta TaxID=2635722 RepID=UPI000E099554|nr:MULTISPECIES: sugar phosphate isomerase [unclassified Oceanispirochaeta]MBF9017565.1 sugar phosphate isomerase [Oceanispirochaeta sp. M2]NPD74137.1 sugar phosphate isomerase [Oceanispirochaeta sp. M1]RDG30058.1 sugar phosphate isomerase [Oceanispirochaeta sp. M1]
MKNQPDYNYLTTDNRLLQEAEKRAETFIRDEEQFQLGFIPTEQSHPYTNQLSSVIQEDTKAGLKLLLDVDRDIPSVARRIFLSEPYEELCKAFEDAAVHKRRVCFTGCGSTGRLSMMLEEMWRQFWEDRAGVESGDASRRSDDSDENLVCADLACSIMTGGDRALIRAVENFEDYEAFGARQVQDLNLAEDDLIIAISEGGETSSVLGTVFEGRKRGCRVFLAFNNPASVMTSRLERCRRAINDEQVTVLDLYTGSMSLSGSTRMQATTMEMLVIAAAMECGLKQSVGIETPENTDYANLFAALIRDLSSDSALEGMAAWAEEEQNVYEQGGRLTYLAGPYLLDIFSDTTERSPTFMLPPFRACDDSTSAISWAFARDPDHEAEEAWVRMLRRSPRGLNWLRKDYMEMDAPLNVTDNPPVLDSSEIARYLIGHEEDPRRRDCSIFLNLKICVDGASSLAGVPEDGKTIFLGSPGNKPDGMIDFSVFLNLPESPISLWQHLAVKLIFNTVSTGTMAMMGRIRGNWMIQLDPTNKKLIDRGSRIISQLLDISYKEACTELYLSLLAREKFQAEGMHTILSPVEAVLKRRSK